MQKTEWRLKGIFKADAAKVGSEIDSIGDSVTPSEVLEYAKSNPDSELHKCFEWDDTVAAEKYRLSQAQQVIRFLMIRTENKDVPAIRKYQITMERRSVYQQTRLFLQQPDEYAALLVRAKAELRAFKNRYHTLSELEEIFGLIDEI